MKILNGCVWQALSTRKEKVLIRRVGQKYVQNINSNTNGRRGKLKRAGGNILYY